MRVFPFGLKVESYGIVQHGGTMKINKTLSSTVFVAVFLLALGGCQEKEGPAEKVGEKIDQAAAELSERVEKATE